MNDKEQAVAFVECAVIGNGLMLLVLGTTMEGWIVVPMGMFGLSLLCAWPYRNRLLPPTGNDVPDAPAAPPPMRARVETDSVVQGTP